VLVLYATKAGWGIAVRRIAEHAMWSVWLIGLLGLVTVIFGLQDLYHHWAAHGAADHDPLIAAKQAWLNTGFFQVRAVIYVLVWSALGLLYSRASAGQDATHDERTTRKMIFFAGPALILFALSTTFAAFDWMMSLDPHWYSTIFGVYYFAGCLVAAFAFMILVATSLERPADLGGAVTDEHFHDLGKLLFAFTVFWAYIGFSQYFLIWYANIPEETLWYLHRSHGSWGTVTLFLAIGHFGVPFFFLMSKHIKRRPALLVTGAAWMLFMQWIDIYWLVMPVLRPDHAWPGLLDLTCLLGIGGLFLALLGWQIRRRAMIPLKDPGLPRSLTFENV